MNRYLVVTLIAVVAIFLSRAQKFKIYGPESVTPERLARVTENNDEKVLLYFWQPNCPPCQQMDPIVDQVMTEHPKVTLVKVDTTNPDNKTVHDTYNITAIPSFVVLHKGKIVAQWVGPFKDKNTFIAFLRPSGSY
jgi:thioredoxin 1